MTLKFGTDGVRGVANVDLTPELVLALGRAAVEVLGGPTFVVGRDTRLSSPMLQAALTAGINASGSSVVDLGVVPTPTVALAASSRSLPAVMISASHNPFGDNGVKFFLPGGHKLSDEVEARLEEALRAILDDPGPATTEVGTVVQDSIAAVAWADHVVASTGRLEGMRVVIDCANGAASAHSPEILRRLGADVTVLADQPNGVNINAGCGSTYPARLQKVVVEIGAEVGLALDGDADRVVAVDHTGAVVDGDQVIALCALDLRARGLLADDTVVVTVMTNLGFRLAMEAQGVHVHETAVGDRYVLEALDQRGWSLGGEQSGHVIFRRLSSTGDGTLTGAQLLDVVRRSGRTLAELADAAMTRLPQVLRNVRVSDREGLAGASSVWDEVRQIELELGANGRVLLRPSGTEPVVRVMVEAPTSHAAEAAVDRLAAAVEAALGV